MRLLLLNQFYPPDVAPTGRYLHDLARFLAGHGCEVQVLCSRRSYDGTASYPRHEILDGVTVSRLLAFGFGRRGGAGRLSDYASFYLSLFAALLFQRKRPDLILSLTTPPYIGLLGKLAAWRYGCPHAHWIMDLYPDVMRAHGMTGQGGLVFNALRRLTRFQLRGAKAVVALGPVMAERVSTYTRNGAPAAGGEGALVAGIPLWSAAALRPWPDGAQNSLRHERGWAPNDVVFLYSGNMGLGHRFGEFLEAARRLGPNGPRWAFCGGGARRAEIEAFARANPSARIEFLEYVPEVRLQEHLGAADVHLASLDSSWQGLIVPSKIQGSFAAGPVLFVGADDNETAAWIRESGAGWVVAENDIAGLLTAIRQALDTRERKNRALAALKFAQEHFEMHSGCTRILKLLKPKQA